MGRRRCAEKKEDGRREVGRHTQGKTRMSVTSDG